MDFLTKRSSASPRTIFVHGLVVGRVDQIDVTDSIRDRLLFDRQFASFHVADANVDGARYKVERTGVQAKSELVAICSES